MFVRRLGADRLQQCSSGHYCPQVLEMTDGNFAIVGEDITPDAIKAIPAGPGVSSTERVVKIPRAVLIAARTDIPMA